MHSFHPYVQRRRKRRRIGGRVVERRNVFWGKNVLFTTQVRRGVLRLFGISSAVFVSPLGSSSPGAVPTTTSLFLTSQEKHSAQGSPGAALMPGHPGCLGICSWPGGAGATSRAEAACLAGSGGVCFTWVRRGGCSPGEHTGLKEHCGAGWRRTFFFFF